MVLMGWPANPDGTLSNYPRDSMSALQPVRMDQNQYVANPTTAISLGVNLPATSVRYDVDKTAEQLTENMSLEYFGNLGTQETLNITFTPTIPASGSSDTWTMPITDSASDDAVIAEYTLTFDGTMDRAERWPA